MNLVKILFIPRNPSLSNWLLSLFYDCPHVKYPVCRLSVSMFPSLVLGILVLLSNVY